MGRRPVPTEDWSLPRSSRSSRSASLLEDFAPVPTEALTQAVPTVPTVPMPTGRMRPRSLEDWVAVAERCEKASKNRSRPVSEEILPPTQKLAEENLAAYAEVG
ncbi:unnamed protein product [Effrenium voratum]|uniref:Uncharacterized protein n=1 Tax=Effrenium voratum TaxID=2562239 RepID=A0AA36JF92_9DINO|nr:unnamed protein product [Effrenium voratum]